MLKRHTTSQIIEQGLPFSRFRYYQRDDEVVLKGEDARCLYYVERGSVEVSYMTNETKIVVGLIGSGEFFGEIGFFDEGTRVRDIRASEDSAIRLFDQDAMNQLKQENPPLKNKGVKA